MTTTSQNFNQLSWDQVGQQMVTNNGTVVQVVTINPTTGALSAGGANISPAAVALTLNQSSAAVANTSAIQSALNLGGSIFLGGHGVAYINATLYIQNSSRLTLDAGLTIRLANGSNVAMLAPQAWKNYLTPTTVTLTWTSGTIATVTWAAHGLTEQDYVWLQGPILQEFIGVFKILQVTDANTFVVSLYRAPNPVSIVTMTIAAPGVISWRSHGLTGNQPVVFTTTGALPTGIVSGTTYYVVQTSITNDTFQVSAAPGGGAITTSGSQSGVHTGTANNGTVSAISCTRDFIVEGGTWDMNIANNGGGAPNFNLMTHVMHACANFHLRNYATVSGQRGITTGACADYKIEKIQAIQVGTTLGYEGIKSYGPSANGLITSCTVKSTDDCSSVQPREDAAYAFTGMPMGDIFNLTIEKCDLKSYGNATSGALPVYAAKYNETIENLSVRECVIWGQNGPGISINSSYGSAKLGSISIERSSMGTGVPATQQALVVSAPVDVLRLKDPVLTFGDNAHFNLYITATAVIRVLEIDGLRWNAPQYPNAYINPVTISGAVDVMTFKNGYVDCNATYMQFGTTGTGSVMGALVFDNFNFRNGIELWAIVGALQTFTARNCNFYNINDVVGPQSTATPTQIILDGNIFNSINVGVVNPRTGVGRVCDISGRGNTFTSAPTVTASGSATFSVHTFDIPVDVGQTGAIKTVSGQYAFNNGSARGTLAQNQSVICDGTNWRQALVPTNLF